MKILCILAHPDDAEIWAGGTIIKHTNRGDQVIVCTFSEPGSIRSFEAEKGARLLGAEPLILDRSLLIQRQRIKKEIEKCIGSFLPNVLITHWDQDTHPEHRFVQEIVSQAIVSPRITTSFPRVLLACDTYNSVGLSDSFSPNIFIDVENVWDDKIKAIKAHVSQPLHIWEDMATTLGKLHGNRCGCKYAEVFRQIPILGQYSSIEFLPEVKNHS